MERKIVIVLTLIFSCFGCSKSSLSTDPIHNSLIGQWVYTETWYSNGSAGGWHAVQPANQTIEFKADGTFIGSESFLKEKTRFKVIDSATIVLLKDSDTTGFGIFYKIDAIKREMIIHPGHPCIEGCADKFKR